MCFDRKSKKFDSGRKFMKMDFDQKCMKMNFDLKSVKMDFDCKYMKTELDQDSMRKKKKKRFCLKSAKNLCKSNILKYPRKTFLTKNL